MMTTNYALFTHERFGYDQSQNGYVFAFIGIIGALVQGGLLRQLLKRQSEKSLAVLGVLLLIVGMALLPLVGGLAALLAVSAVVGIGNSFVTPTLNGLASRSAERTWQGRVIGLMQSSGSLARCLAPFLAGKLLFDGRGACLLRTHAFLDRRRDPLRGAGADPAIAGKTDHGRRIGPMSPMGPT